MRRSVSGLWCPYPQRDASEVSRGESGCRSSFRRRYERPGMVLKRDPVLDQATRKHCRDRAVFLVDQGDHMLKVVAAKTGATEHVIQDDPRVRVGHCRVSLAVGIDPEAIQ